MNSSSPADGGKGKNFFKHWAILATALALVLAGILIGQQIGERRTQPGQTDADHRPQRQPDQVVDNSLTSGQNGVSPETYNIPDSFDEMPSEWRTAPANGDFSGYAALFDPQRREVIVEQCRHPGYMDPRSGQPLETTGIEFCVPVLWATLESLDERSARARDRSGESVDLALNYSGIDTQPQLTMEFKGHKVTLVTGSKNDLFQEMERSPEMMAQRQRKWELMQTEIELLRREQEKRDGDDKSGGDRH